MENFDNLLSRLEMTEEEYINAIQSCLTKPTIFLKRDINSIRVNPYNKTLLELWRANCDIQFIFSPYECVQYVLNYIQKSERGMSLLLRENVEELKKGNVEIKE